MIIGICGLIGSGKGSVADILVENHNFEKLSFADKLKDGVASVFSWDRDMLEGDTDRSRIWREKEDKFWTNETGTSVTPRLVLQLFGTDCMRNGFFDGIWVSLVNEKLLVSPDSNWIQTVPRVPRPITHRTICPTSKMYGGCMQAQYTVSPSYPKCIGKIISSLALMLRKYWKQGTLV